MLKLLFTQHYAYAFPRPAAGQRGEPAIRAFPKKYAVPRTFDRSSPLRVVRNSPFTVFRRMTRSVNLMPELAKVDRH